MSHHRLLTLLSLLAMVLVMVHGADDFILGFDRAMIQNWYLLSIWVVWSCGVALWRDRVSGRIILLLGGIAAVAVPVIHLNGRGYGDAFVHSGAAIRFIVTLYALGTIGPMMIILSVREMLESQRRGDSR